LKLKNICQRERRQQELEQLAVNTETVFFKVLIISEMLLSPEIGF
jgi:hypothetical protein